MQREGSKSRTLLCLAALLLVSACTNMGFERGGSARGFAEARNQCKAVPAEDYKNCMRKAGWFTGGPSLAPPAKPAVAGAMPKPKPAPQEAQPTQQPSKPAVEKVGGSDVAQAPQSIAESPSPPTEPEDAAMVAAGSWWKIGGSAAALKQALKACGATPADHMVSRATLACMQAKGWYAQGS